MGGGLLALTTITAISAGPAGASPQRTVMSGTSIVAALKAKPIAGVAKSSRISFEAVLALRDPGVRRGW